MDKIWRYHYTSHKKSRNWPTSTNQGIGLPIARAYAHYLGGEVEMKSLHGIGCDTYLKLAHIDPRVGHSFRIWKKICEKRTFWSLLDEKC